MNHRHRTKIIATLGPASDDPAVLAAMIDAGMDLARINFSHGTIEQHQKRIELIRSLAKEKNKQIGVIADLQGPKIRIAKFKNKSVTLKNGAHFILDTACDDNAGDDTRVGIDYKELLQDVQPGDQLLLNDGLIELRVDGTNDSEILTTVIVGGELSNNKGINKRNGGLSAPALTEKDIHDLKAAIQMGADYVAISFVRHAEDVELAKQLIKEQGSQAAVIAKIERREALDVSDAIIKASDAIMVARGDLAVEIGAASIPSIQKELIQRARSLDKAVITATQMMESMIHQPVPTRAEVSDVANAVLDGSDAVMLSAETAAGEFPVATIEMMAGICQEAEKHPSSHISKHRLECTFKRVDEAIAMATMYTANHLGIKAIIALTESGATTCWMSRIRSGIPIYGLSRHISTQRKITLYRGVFPIDFDPTDIDRRAVNFEAVETLKQQGVVKDGDLVIITKGNFMGTMGGTNAMKIVEVGAVEQ